MEVSLNKYRIHAFSNNAYVLFIKHIRIFIIYPSHHQNLVAWRRSINSLLDGGELIDSPGVREYQLWHVSADELEDAFIDFRPWRGQCRFRDCHHLREPGCALLLAVERGELSGERLDNFLRIREGLKDAPGIRE